MAYYGLIRASDPLSPVSLSVSRRVFAHWPWTRGSLIYSARPSVRAAFHTSAGPAGVDCSLFRQHWPSSSCKRLGVRIRPTPSVLVWGRLSRLQSSLYATARTVAALLRQGLLRSSFRHMSHLNGTSNITTRANSQFPRPVFHRLDTQPYRLHCTPYIILRFAVSYFFSSHIPTFRHLAGSPRLIRYILSRSLPSNSPSLPSPLARTFPLTRFPAQVSGPR